MKNRNVLIFAFALTLVSVQLFSQNIIIGDIKDLENQPIPFANIYLQTIDKKKVIAFSISDENGRYEMRFVESGIFLFIISASSYKDDVSLIETKVKNQKIHRNTILKLEPLILNEVFVLNEKSILLKKDTIIFSAKSFLQGDERVVEDLLRKIPGLNINEDGTIKVGNKEVEKVMIDGDDLFEKGYKILTKNMPVDPIGKIEILQKYSSNSLLKGIEKSDRVALNLLLKDDSKRKWFGDLAPGYAFSSTNKHEISSNLMNFGKKNKYYAIANLNNLGNDVTGDINNLIRPYTSDESSIIGDDQNANALLNINSYMPSLSYKRININNAKIVALNSIIKLSEKLKVKALGFFNFDEQNISRSNNQSIKAGTLRYHNHGENKLLKKTLTAFTKIDMVWSISENQSLEYTGKYNHTNDNNTNSILFNNYSFDETLRNNNKLLDNKISFTKKINNSNVLLLTTRIIEESLPQKYDVNPILYQDIFGRNAEELFENSTNKMKFIGIEAHYMTRRKGGNLFEIKAGNKFRNDLLNSYVHLKDKGIVIKRPLNYQNDISYNTNDLYLKGKLYFQLKKLGLYSKTGIHLLNNVLIDDISNQNQTPLLFNSGIGMGWEMDISNKLEFFVSYNMKNAKISDIYSQYVNSNFRMFQKGTGSLNQTDASTALVEYTFGNWADRLFVNTSILYSKSFNYYSINTFVFEKYFQEQKILFKNKEDFTISTTIDIYIKKLSSNLKFNVDGIVSTYKTLLNNTDLVNTKDSEFLYRLELRSAFLGIFNFHIGSQWNDRKIISTTTNKYFNIKYFLDLVFDLNKQIQFKILSERYSFHQNKNNKNKYYFIDAEFKYIPEKSKMTFSLSGNNLIDVKLLKNYYINEISISETIFRIMPRYLLFKIGFKF